MNNPSPDHIVVVEPDGTLAPSAERYAVSRPSAGSAGARGVQRAVFSVEEIFGYLRKYGLLAAVLGLLAGAGVYIFIQSRPPVFESTAVVLLNQGNGKQLNLETIHAEERSEYTLPQLVNNLRNEIGSDKFRMSLYRVLSPRLRAAVIGEKSPEEQAADEEALFLDRLASQIHIEVIKDSHMVSVTAKSDDGHTAAALANAYVEHFLEYSRKQEMETTRKVADFLQSKANDLLVRVKKLERELLEYREQQGITGGEADSEFAVNKVNNLNRQLVDAKLHRERLAEMLEIIAAAGKEPEDLLKVPALAENVVLEKAYAQLTAARSTVETLSIDFGRKHPRMIVAANKERAALENLNKLVGQTVGSLRRQLKTTTSKVASLEAKVAEAKVEVKIAGNKSVSQELKEEQLKSGRELYNSLLRQRNEANIALQFNGVERVRITEQAVAKSSPAFPSKPLSAVLGCMAFGGCFFGVPLTLGLGKRVLQTARGTGVNPEPAALGESRPAALACRADSAPFPQPSQTAEPMNYPTLVTFSKGDTSHPRAWVRNASDPSARSGAELNAFLTRLISEPNQARGLIVTSNHASPAKTLSAAALALAASRRGLRTLLVSSEKLTPAAPGGGMDTSARAKPADELLAPFTTGEERLYFITDEAWKRIPALCLETLTHAHHCVDLLIMDAPLLDSESDLALMSGFAASVVLVRHAGEAYDHGGQQARFRRILPACSVTGEFVIAGD